MHIESQSDTSDLDFLFNYDAAQVIKVIINDSSEPMIITNESSQIVLINQLVEKLFGYSRKSIIGRTINKLILFSHKEEHINNFIMNPIPSGTEEKQSLLAIDIDGNEIPVDISINNVNLSNQNICIYTFKTKNNIVENEKLINNVVKKLPVTVYRLKKDESWGIEFLSRHIKDITGYDKSEFHTTKNLLSKIIHDDDKDIVFSEVKNAIENNHFFSVKYRIKHKNGKTCWLHENGKATFENNSIKWIDGVILDITESEHQSEKLSYHATHDSLTGLVNRVEFENTLKNTIEDIKHNNSGPHSLFYIDLDQFKIINDTCGHTAGDQLLKDITNILKTKIRKRDTLARLAGDEFAILMRDCTLEQSSRIAESIQKKLKEYTFKWNNIFFKTETSIGIVEINNNDNDISHERILMNVDTACLTAKEAGGDCIHIYQDNDTEVFRKFSEMEWVNRINMALENNDFYLSFQKIIEVQPKTKGMHFEVLIRLLQNGEQIPPNDFLPSAEKYNLSAKIDTWVFEQVIKYLSNNHDFLDKLKLCSINLSGNSLGNFDLLHKIISTFENIDFPAHKICFEITETAIIRNRDKANDMIQAIRNIGCKFALDDFGTGLSSLAYLRTLYIDYLKFDGMFIKHIESDPINYSIVKSVNEIANVMNIETCAEFIENEKSLEKIKEIGITYAQGFHIGKPMDIHNINDVNDFVKSYS